MTPMIRKLTGLIEKARKLESTIAARVEGAAGRVTGAPAARQPIEVAQAIVDTVAREIQPTGRGGRGFPFNQIRVALLAPNARTRAQLQAVLEGEQAIQARIEERLGAAGCTVKHLSVRVSYVGKSRPEWTTPEFNVECARVPDAEAAVTKSEARLELVVLAGATARSSHHFGAALVAIGRGSEVCDSKGRLIRTNHVAFTEGGGEINHTVSRLHARIEHDPSSGVYRVFDEGSAQGTSIVRNGRGYTVPRGTRGMVLSPGDEIVLGRARLKVRITTAPDVK